MSSAGLIGHPATALIQPSVGYQDSTAVFTITLRIRPNKRQFQLKLSKFKKVKFESRNSSEIHSLRPKEAAKEMDEFCVIAARIFKLAIGLISVESAI